MMMTTTMENLARQTSTAMTPFLLLIPQLISSVFTTEKEKSPYKLNLLLHYLVSLTLFLLRLIVSRLPTPYLSQQHDYLTTKPNKTETNEEIDDSALARALWQILITMVDLPVTSRKYETVRSLADKIIDENLEEGSHAVLQVNRRVLVAALVATLGRLEEVIVDDHRLRVKVAGNGLMDYQRFGWVWNAAKSKVGLVDQVGPPHPPLLAGSAHKLAAEVLWLAHKLVACGYGEEAVSRWGEASRLSLLALSAEPSIQTSLLKISAFLFMQARELGDTKEDDETQREEQIQTRKRMLISWLPLLCCASNGTDSPVLSNMEKKELEKALEHIIEMLKEDNEQEQVLSLWLHHFTSCPSSDWPNLQACYNRWCSMSRKRLAAQ